MLGQLDAYIDPYAALLAGPEAAHWRATSRRLYDGKVFGLFPYDIAAAIGIAREAGAFIVDANGRSLEEVNLLDSSEASLLSCVVAANPDLGTKLTSYLATRFPQV